jgi:uncharacterized protein (TIGR02996 family)
MKNQRAAFLADVIEHPDDDAPRLVFADWLEDNGDAPRAEFIRAQIAWARTPEDDPRRDALHRQAWGLLHDHGKAWLAEVPAWARGEALFVRGFVMQISATAREFLESAPGLFRRAPIRAVKLRSASDKQLVEVTEAGHLGRVAELNLNSNMLSDDSLRPVLLSPKLGPLAALDLGSNRFTTDTVRALAESPRLRHLADLSLSMHKLGPQGARVLADSENISRLESLNLWSGDVYDEGAAALFGSPRLGPLKKLNLGHNGLRTEGARAIAGCAALSG